ncbi:MAG TPA: Ig-like domain-containing protein [Solirubrobacteraceae bacterium]|nr:Ig-like domain-containing protein [Solirubrobacteraceae bacterium]
MLRSSFLPLLALLALLCAGASTTAAKPRALRLACTPGSGGALRYAAGACRPGERVVRFSRAVRVCAQGHHPLRSGRCRRSFVLPAVHARMFCVDRHGLRLRRPPCARRGVFIVVLPGRGSTAVPVPPAGAPASTPPVARDDELTLDEDHVTRMAVLDNDSGEQLRVASVDHSHVAGAVTLQADGTIVYDPRGRFDWLRSTEQATELFTYRLAGGQSATVFVTVTGVDDAPRVSVNEDAPLVYDTGAQAAAVAPRLAIEDPDSPTLAGAIMRIASPDGGDELLPGGDVPAGPIGDVRLALRALAFRTAALTSSGTRRIEITVDDGERQSDTVARDIAVHHVNLPPTAVDDSFTGAYGNTALAVGTTPSGPHTSVSGSVLANDADADGPAAALTASAPATAPSGARVAMNTNGTFTYVPPAGFTGQDSFSYTVSDNDAQTPRTATGTITVTVAGPVTWYVDAAAAPGGDGSSDAPFTSLAPLSSGGSADARDGNGDRIFVYGSTAPYAGGIVLEPNQQLVGQPKGLTAGTTTLVPASGANPVIDGAGAPAVTLAGGVDVQRVDMRANGAPAVVGNGVDAATIGTSTAIGGANGGVALDGGTGTLSIGSAITTTGGRSVAVAHRTAGRVTFQGAVNDSGAGIALSANAGATIVFTGRITASTGASPAFAATGGGTISATGVGSTLTTTTASTVDVRNTTIAAGGLLFQGVSSNGAPSGIVLDTTGAQGGLSVNGGTISAATGDAVALTDATRTSLKGLRVSGAAGAGIRGERVHGLTLLDSTVSGPVTLHQADGTLDVERDALPAGLTVSGDSGTIGSLVVQSNTVGGSGIGLSLGGTPTTVASLTKGPIAYNTTPSITLQAGNPAGGPVGTYGIPSGGAPGGPQSITIHDNAVTADPGTGAITVALSGRAVGNVAVTANGTPAAPVHGPIDLSVAGAVSAEFAALENVVDAGADPASPALALHADGAGAILHADALSNQIAGSGGPGVAPSATNGAELDLRLTGTSGVAPTAAGTPGIAVTAGGRVCADITQNVIPGNAAADLLLDQQPAGTLGLAGIAPDPASAPQAEAFLGAANSSASVTVAGAGPFAGCALPF